MRTIKVEFKEEQPVNVRVMRLPNHVIELVRVQRKINRALGLN